MKARNTIVIYAEVPEAMHRRLRRVLRVRGLKLVQAVRWALADWLDHADEEARGKILPGGKDGKEG